MTESNVINLRTLFLRLIVPSLVIFSILTGALFAWRDFTVAEASRVSSQQLIFNTFASAIKQPMIQGSTVEAEIRAEELEKNPQVICVEIKASNSSVRRCTKDLSRYSRINTIAAGFHFTDEASPIFATVRISFDNSDLETNLIRNVGTIFFAFMVLGLLLYFALSKGFERIQKEIHKLILQAEGDEKTQAFRIREFRLLSDSLKSHMRASKEAAEIRAVAEMSQQVAHDIRSPLAAMKAVLKSMDQNTSAMTRETLELAVRRIVEVSNGLDQQTDAGLKGNSEFEQSSVLLNVAAREIVSEKRAQLATSAIEILETSSERPLLIGRIGSSNLKRILSNLLDNAVQALPGYGLIRLDFTLDGDFCDISISDDGVGIPAEVLPKLFDRGATFGKPGGKGLGLSWAREALRSCGGDVTLTSVKNRGTVVVARIPLETSAEILPHILVEPGQTVTVLDDDPSVAQAWKYRSEWKKLAVDLHYWSSSVEVPSHILESSNLFLVDYDFGPGKPSGLDLIRRFGIAERSVLVTSKYRSPDVLVAARAMNVPVLPKEAIETVYILPVRSLPVPGTNPPQVLAAANGL